ncbi:MAG: flagellar motor switch protein FliN [Bdellovibrionales bacterium]|nr:flagellar motor switch protein FliN [Bdellovibrionales bacterium]
MADETQDTEQAVKGVAQAAEGMVAATAEQPQLTGGGQQNLDFLLDVALQVSVEVGRCRMSIQDLLQLGQGSVIELTKLAGEPLDIFINERPIARGEAVIVNEKFGVRITDIISQQERIEGLG